MRIDGEPAPGCFGRTAAPKAAQAECVMINTRHLSGDFTASWWRLGIFIRLEGYEAADGLAEGLIANGDIPPHTWLQEAPGSAIAARSRRPGRLDRFFMRS